MVDQELKIKFKDQDKTIGILTISAINRHDYISNLKETPVKSNNYKLYFQNIPKKADIDTRIPIIYKTQDTRYNPPLMLLEETEYQILFKTDIKTENISFPSLVENNDEIILKIIKMGKGYYGGLLNFKSFVGQSFFDIKIDDYKSVKCPFEVRSKKMGYEDHYPAMIADISEALSGLIFREKSPLFRLIDFKDRVKRSFYEDFMFLEYIFRPENLIMTYGHVSRDPHYILRKFVETIPAASATYLGPSDVINMINTPGNLDRFDDVPVNWPSQLQGYVPREVSHRASEDTFDNPENRFVKYFLNLLADLIEEMQNFVKERNLEGYPVEKLSYIKRLFLNIL